MRVVIRLLNVVSHSEDDVEVRRGAAEARWAHNPKVLRSKRSDANPFELPILSSEGHSSMMNSEKEEGVTCHARIYAFQFFCVASDCVFQPNATQYGELDRPVCAAAWILTSLNDGTLTADPVGTSTSAGQAELEDQQCVLGMQIWGRNMMKARFCSGLRYFSSQRRLPSFSAFTSTYGSR